MSYNKPTFPILADTIHLNNHITLNPNTPIPTHHTQFTIIPQKNITTVPNIPHASTIIINPYSHLNVESFPYLPNLKHLEIGLLASQLPTLPKSLETLIIQNYTSEDQLDLSKLPNLKHFEIVATRCRPFHINLDMFPELRLLRARFISKFQVSYTKKHENIEELYIENDIFNPTHHNFPRLRKFISTGKILSDPIYTPSLEHLEFTGCEGGPVPIGFLKNLNVLKVSNVKNVKIVIPEYMHKLERLEIYDLNSIILLRSKNTKEFLYSKDPKELEKSLLLSDNLTYDRFPSLKHLKISGLVGELNINHNALVSLDVKIKWDYPFDFEGNINILSADNIETCNFFRISSVKFHKPMNRLEEFIWNNPRIPINVDMKYMPNLIRIRLSEGSNMIGSEEKIKEVHVEGFYKKANSDRVLRPRRRHS